MPTTRSRVFTVRKLSQLRAMASPVRQQILVALESGGPSTARELAERLGRLPESLYYHLRALSKAGLVVEVESRPGARRAEAVFGLPAGSLRVDPEPRSPAWCAALVRSVAAIFRSLERDFAEAIAHPDTVRSGPRREVEMRFSSVRLSAEGLARLNRRLEELYDELQTSDAGEGDATFSLMTALVPAGVRHRSLSDDGD